jgi:hypothetical protein
MDITDRSPTHVAIAIEELQQGECFTYESIRFSRDTSTQPPTLNVSSYSGYDHLENVTPEEAREKIARSKEVAADLALKNAQFSEIWKNDKKEFHFCYDYGMGAIGIAEEINGILKWNK